MLAMLSVPLLVGLEPTPGWASCRVKAGLRLVGLAVVLPATCSKVATLFVAELEAMAEALEIPVPLSGLFALLAGVVGRSIRFDA